MKSKASIILLALAAVPLSASASEEGTFTAAGRLVEFKARSTEFFFNKFRRPSLTSFLQVVGGAH